MARKAQPDKSARQLRREAESFSRYLIGEKKLPIEFVQRYQAFWQEIQVDSSQQSLIEFACKYPRLIGLLESGAAILTPDHFLRRKLLSMTAILEASPVYTSHFLPDRKSHPLILIQLMYIGTRGALKSALGVLVYLVVRKCCTT